MTLSYGRSKTNSKDVDWYVENVVGFLISQRNQQLVSDQMINEKLSVLFFVEGTVFRKIVNSNEN